MTESINHMKRFILYLFIVLISLPAALAAKEEGVPTYQIEGAGTATQGNYLVTVTVETKKKDVSDATLVKAAVHGVLFRGFSNPDGRRTQRPLAGSAANEAQHADFYKEFFGADGTASTYGTVVSGSRSVMKSGKVYKTKATVTVSKENLLRYLQDAGMVRSLNAAF